MRTGIGFGEQGQQSSQQCAWQICTICRAPIRLSYFVGIFFCYQLLQVASSTESMGIKYLTWYILQATGREIILLMTILCHEFGHGNMARYLGGEISHILLWVFGGICFHTGARSDMSDPAKLLRNDLLIVSAGPATHFVQAPVWGIVLWALFAGLGSQQGTGYKTAWDAFVASLDPLGGGVDIDTVVNTANMWVALPWSLVGSAIQLNVALFLFNVFFPMYPADGAKLLTTSLMFFCGVPPRTAAWILLGVSVPCAFAMIVYTIWSFKQSGNLLGGVAGWMAVMSLVEAHNIWLLLKQHRIHQHPLFFVARSWQQVQRDEYGVVHRVNISEFDDQEPLMTAGCCRQLLASMCCPSRESSSTQKRSCLCCPCFGSAPEPLQAAAEAVDTQERGALRNQRGRLLDQIEQGQADRQRPVSNYGATSSPKAGS